MEKIVIFGSTGTVGLRSIEAALKKGIKVRAFDRDHSKLPDSLKNNVEVFHGDVLKYDDVLKAVMGVTGVVIALGIQTDLTATPVLSEGTDNILQAMKSANVKVVSVCLSAYLFSEVDKVPPMFRDLHKHHTRQLDSLKQSNLNYIAVLPPYFTYQPSEVGYKVEHDALPGRWDVSIHDVGNFLVDSLTLPEHYCKVCGISAKEPASKDLLLNSDSTELFT